jgi:hypothetical protein
VPGTSKTTTDDSSNSGEGKTDYIGVDLEKESLAKFISEVRDFLAIARKLGSERYEFCQHLNEDGLCDMCG